MKIERVSSAVYLITAACLNPYSNGMKIERLSGRNLRLTQCLNPYSNGMKIEHS